MPYKSIRDLGKGKEDLPKHAKEIFKSAYNAACKEYGDDEERCHKIAWSAVKKKYKKKGEDWVLKESKYSKFLNEDPDIEENESTPQEEFEQHLMDLLLDDGRDFVKKVKTFEESGVMTKNRGLVVETNFGKFQLTIV